MKSFKLLFLGGIAAAALSGCGGGHGGSSNNPSPFVGTWTGNIVDQNNLQIATTWSVNTAGYITGSDNNNGTVGTDGGFVDLNGALKVTSSAPGFTDILYAGNVNIAANGHLIGTGTENIRSQNLTITFDLAPKN